MIRDFELISPACLAECVEAVGKHGDAAACLAGGTDLHVTMRAGIRSPRVVIWLGKVAELERADERDGRMFLGATLTHSEISRLPMLACIGSLGKAAASVGSPQVRNAGTLGGNLANASPAGDLYPPLLTLDAEVVLASAEGERTVRLEDFATGPGSTRRRAGEIVAGVVFDRPAAGTYFDFAKIGLRNAVAISVASVAISARLENGEFDDVRIACGAVAPRPVRMRRVEALLQGEALTGRLLAGVEATAARTCDPVTDLRATSTYRRHVTGVTVSRLVEGAWQCLSGAT
jgi:CO/xanthine dehydrogenase FAD-binding subunit